MRDGSDVPEAANWLAPQGPREGLSHYAEVIRGRLGLILACVVVATVAAGLYVKLTPSAWTAESQLLITPVNGETSLIGLGLLTNSGNPTGAISTAASFVTTPEVAALVAARVQDTTASAALGEVSAVPVAQSNIIAIKATAPSAAKAQAVASAFALETVQNRTLTLHRQLDKIIPSLKAQVEALPVAQRTGQGSLGERLASLQALRAAPDPTISVETLAPLPTAPSSPKTKLSIVAGILVGLVIGLGVAFAQDGLDPRVRREEGLRTIFRLPVLARIPRERSRRSRASHGLPLRPSDLSPAAQEGYRMLRVALGVRGASSISRSLMITGSTSSEGKSTTALNLAATIASAGRRVILIEADLQRPSLAMTLGMHSSLGMADVLMGEVTLEDALVTVDWLGDNLKLLVAERADHYLADSLLTATDKLVGPAKALADYVIFDAPPVTEVSEILPLCQHVDDLLIVTRLGRSRVDQLVNLGEILTRQGVRPVGIVIVDDDLNQSGGYYYGRVSSGSNRRLPWRKRVAATRD
jgi:Mrp family chromosome partitioning ATPase/capsular polysaccharide biosynthesis protein